MLRLLFVASLVAFSLAACGYKGPLVLPDQVPPKPAATPQPKDNDKDKPAASTQPAASIGDPANKNQN